MKNFPLPDYDASVRPDDIAKWQQVMQDVAEFEGKVDPNELTVSG